MVSLIMIFAMSLLGISAMRSGSLSSRMVTNAIEKDLTLQVAESASDYVIKDSSALEQVICSPDPLNIPVDLLNQSGVLTTTATAAYEGETLAIGYSLDSGFAAMRFASTGTATLDASSTSTLTSQGVYIIGPKGSSGGC